MTAVFNAPSIDSAETISPNATLSRKNGVDSGRKRHTDPMAAKQSGLTQSELQALVRANAAFELVARSLKRDGETWWTIDIVLSDAEPLFISKARSKEERRVWKQLSALQRFLATEVPEVGRLTVELETMQPKGPNHASKKKNRSPTGKRT